MHVDQNCQPSRNTLPTGHLNISHVLNKITDVTTTISNFGKWFDLSCFSESRLTGSMASSDSLIPGYTIVI